MEPNIPGFLIILIFFGKFGYLCNLGCALSVIFVEFDRIQAYNQYDGKLFYNVITLAEMKEDKEKFAH